MPEQLRLCSRHGPCPARSLWKDRQAAACSFQALRQSIRAVQTQEQTVPACQKRFWLFRFFPLPFINIYIYMDKSPRLQCELWDFRGGCQDFSASRKFHFSLEFFNEFYGLQSTAVSLSYQGWLADGPTTAQALSTCHGREFCGHQPNVPWDWTVPAQEKGFR